MGVVVAQTQRLQVLGQQVLEASQATADHLLGPIRWKAKQLDHSANHYQVSTTYEVDIACQLIHRDGIQYVVTGVSGWCGGCAIIEDHATRPQFMNVIVIACLIERHQHVNVIALRQHRLVGNARLEGYMPSQDFGWEGAKGIHLQTGESSDAYEDFTNGHNSFARLTADTNHHIIYGH